MLALSFVNNILKDFTSKKKSRGADDASFNWDSSSYYRGHSFAFLDKDPFAAPKVQVVSSLSTASTNRTAVNSSQRRTSQDFKAVHPKKRKQLSLLTFTPPVASTFIDLPPLSTPQPCEPVPRIEIHVTVETYVHVDPSTADTKVPPSPLKSPAFTIHDRLPSPIVSTPTVPEFPEPKAPPTVTPQPQSPRMPFMGSLGASSIKSLASNYMNPVKAKVGPRAHPMDQQRWDPPTKRYKKIFTMPRTAGTRSREVNKCRHHARPTISRLNFFR